MNFKGEELMLNIYRGKPTDMFQGGSLVRNVKKDETISHQK